MDRFQQKYDKKKTTRKEFEEWAVQLTKHLSVNINFDEISVARYCMMMNSYDRFVEVHNAQKNNLLEKGNGARQDKFDN